MSQKVFCSIKNLILRYKIPLITSFVVAAFTYMYAFTNKLPNHDDVSQLFDKGVSVESGRWGLELMRFIFPDCSMPWIYGVLSVLFVAAAVCVIIKIFGIKNRFFQALLAALVVSFPSLIATYTYMFTATSFMLSFLLAVLAVFFLFKQRVPYIVLAVGFMVLSLGIYQSYISLAAGLLLVYILKCILSEEMGTKRILIKVLVFLGFLILSLGLYYLVTQIVFSVTGTGLGEYASSHLNNANEGIFLKLKIVYAVFIDEFVHGANGLMPSAFSRILHIVIALIICALCVRCIVIIKNLFKKVLFILILVLLPMAVNCMYLFTESSSVHTLVLFGFVSVYVLVIVLLDSFELKNDNRMDLIIKNISMPIIIIASAGILMSNIYTGNEVFLNMQLSYENTYSFYNSVVTQIKMNPKFSEGTKIAFIGETKDICAKNRDFSNNSKIMGSDGVTENMYSREKFVKYYIGFDAKFATEKEKEKIVRKNEFKNMSKYPYYGSIDKIDEYMVVKFSE